jgi:methionyl-tRNA formyltransferase
MLQMLVSSDEVNPFALQLEQSAASFNVPFKRISKTGLKTELPASLDQLKPDVVLVFAFGYKIPAEILTIPKFGFFNIHFSLLPKYRGRCPVFWQLKNGDTDGGVSIHRVTSEFDAGPLLMQKHVPLGSADTHGIYWGRLSMESISVIASAIENLKTTGDSLLLEQNDSQATIAPTPTPDDFKIKWQTQTAQEIENLVRACNPDYGGALTLFRNQVFRILEVSIVQLNGDGHATPGTIVYADANNGIFVACLNNQFLRINIIHSNEGFLSGFKLAALGIQAGEQMQIF